MAIRHLPFFVVAAEEQNFHRAAARLHVTQPALSRRIQDLESSVGFALFERGHGRVELTPAGAKFAVEARRILEDFEASTRRVRSLAGGWSESLQIGLNEHSMRITQLTNALGFFRRAHAQVRVTVRLMSSARQLAALQEAQLDVALLYAPEQLPPQLLSREITNDDPYVVALLDTHPLAAADKLVLADLEGEELIWPSGEQVPALYEKLRSAWRAAGLEPDVTIEIASAEAALNAVGAGLGVAVVRESNAGREPPGVVLKVVSDLNISLRTSICWMDRPPSRALSAFLQLLVDQHVTTD